MLGAIHQALYDATNWLVGTLYEWSLKVFYGVTSFLLGLLGDFLAWLFADKLDWLPILEEPEWLLQWAEIANNFVPVDQFVTYLSAYMAFEFSLFLWSWTRGLFWAP